ncbi:MAG: glycosyltransferase family 2 protein [Saprospiraceae bacterium]|nr:glycosyltransferase family 2 protein [Saprospiraceae bacterium]
MEVFIITLYALPMILILLYSIGQLHLIYLYIRNRISCKSTPSLASLDTSTDKTVPYITVQLPIYNELYVVEDLINAICAFDYPCNRLEIQVLDDSTDETVDIIAKKVAYFQEKGIDIHHIRRPDRKGFKAGALSYGLEFCKGEFVAVFDADFLPHQDFLKKTVPFFEDPTIGLVQTKWEHINEDYSLLTRLQAMALDAHFSVEQMGRNMGHFINFNGTAGIWRKSCINDAGGWAADTLTEDLDLSYRAQLKGWRFQYLSNIGTPAELPVAMNAFKSQQFRWMKGAAECARKNLWRVLRSKQDLGTKFHAVFHLLNSGVFICVLIMSILSIPVSIVMYQSPEYIPNFQWIKDLGYTMIVVALFFGAAHHHRHGFQLKELALFILRFPLLICISMGLSLHNGLAVLEGYSGKKTPFIRTPKFNVKSKTQNWQKNKYISQKINSVMFLETFLLCYFVGGMVLDFYLGYMGLLMLHTMLVAGYTIVCGYSFYHTWRTN